LVTFCFIQAVLKNSHPKNPESKNIWKPVNNMFVDLLVISVLPEQALVGACSGKNRINRKYLIVTLEDLRLLKLVGIFLYEDPLRFDLVIID